MTIQSTATPARLAGKNAIVTGAGPNIGGAIAAGLAAAGARVACNDVMAEACDAAVARVERAGSEGMALVGDAADSAFVERAIDDVLQRWGTIDILVNGAVRYNIRGILSMPVEDYRAQIDLILTGAFLWTKYVAQAMIDRGTRGSIINLLSTAAWQGQPGNIGYCTAKSGLINFNKSAAMELAEYGIRVNGFTPTATLPTDPESLARTMALAESMVEDGPNYDFDVNQVPLGRVPSPEDYVGALVFLASDESSMMTGSNITVDGGALAKYWVWIPHNEAAK